VAVCILVLNPSRTWDFHSTIGNEGEGGEAEYMYVFFHGLNLDFGGGSVGTEE
jgi:hypothetical protein